MKRAFLACLFASATARAAQDDLLPRPLPGPTLPELTHPGVTLLAEHTLASIGLGGAEPRRTSMSIHRLAFDVPLVARRWYAFGAWSFALGRNDGEPTACGTNTELGVRAVWASITGLAFGGGIAMIAPTTSIAQNSSQALLLGEAATVRSWDRPLFEPDTFAFRPFVDVRTVSGRFSAQFRQILDMVASGSTAVPLVETYRLAAVALLFVGFRVFDSFGLGVELAERYDLDSRTPDADRPRFALGVSARVHTRWFDPSIAMIAALGSPLNAFSTVGAPIDRAPASFVGVRIGLGFGGFDPPWPRPVK